MIRVALELLGAFALPFLGFAILLRLRRALALSEPQWTRDIAITLSLIGFFACAALILAIFLFSERGMGPYQPAHVENGRVIPGHIQQ